MAYNFHLVFVLHIVDLNTRLVWDSNGQKLFNSQWPVFECHLNTGLSLVRYSDHRLDNGPVYWPYLTIMHP